MAQEYNDLIEKDVEKLRAIANRLFSSDDGKKYAQLMFKASRLFQSDRGQLSGDNLVYISAWQDFVNLFVTKLVDKKVLLDIFEYERKE